MSLRIVIRADAGPSIGGGHAYRTAVLGERLQMQGAEVVYATRSESLTAVPSLESHGFRLLLLDSVAPFEEPIYIKEALGELDLFVLDHYHRGIEFERAVLPFSARLLVLDDLPTRQHACDFLLDQTLGRQAAEYRSLIPSDCVVMTGPRYALLRPQFSRARRAGRCRKRKSISRLLVMVGAGDISGVLNWTMDALSCLEVALDIDIVTASEAYSELDGKALGKSRISIHRHVTDMASLIADADLAIGAAGSASWERCCLGLPALLFILAENQIDVCQALHESGAAVNLGHFPGVSREHFLGEVRKLLNSERLLSKLSEKAALLCDGRGAERLLELVFDENQSL